MQGALTLDVVMQQGQWSRLFWSALLHSDDTHLMLNVSSFLWKVRCRRVRINDRTSRANADLAQGQRVFQGAILEPQLGSGRYAALLLELLVLSHGMILPVTKAVAMVAPSYSDLYYRCALLLTHMRSCKCRYCECAMRWIIWQQMCSNTHTCSARGSHHICRSIAEERLNA